ncbi:chromosomal replication initiator protein DnaA, partial [Vibrio cholerae]|nr:chromosomal replication initiator protein DnaA [Vibrio cholerae]
AHNLKKDVLTITAPNEFARDWLESHYSELISETLYDLTGAKLAIRFIIPQSQAEEEIDLPPAKPNAAQDDSNHLPQSMLNPKYTFDT